MRCGKTRSLFSLVYDQEAGAAAAEFEIHLEGCGDCRESWAEYRADLAGLGPALASMAQVVESWPERPLSLESIPRRRWIPFGPVGWAWGAVAVALVGVVTLYWSDVPVADPSSLAPPVQRAAQDPIAEAPEPPVVLDSSSLIAAEFLDRNSLPVVAPRGLDRGYRLLDQELLGGGTCPEEVRLAYGCRNARLQVEALAALENREQRCLGSLVSMNDRVACLEHGRGQNGFELRWTRGARQFRLTGYRITPDEVLDLARDLDQRYVLSLAGRWY